MKKKFILPLVVLSMIFTSCGGNGGGSTPPSKQVTGIELSNVVSEYTVGDEFARPTVTAKYDDESSSDVTSESRFTGYNMNEVGHQTVHVTYSDFLKTYQITVNAKETPKAKLTGIEVGMPKTEYEVGDEFVKPTVLAVYDDGSSVNVTSQASFTGYDLNTVGDYTVTVKYGDYTDTYSISVSNSKTVFNVAIATEIGNVDNIAGTTKNVDIFDFGFARNDEASSNPKSSKDNDGYIALYDKNSMSIHSIRKIIAIEMELKTWNNYNPDSTLIANVGTYEKVTRDNVKYFTWSGEENDIVITASLQNRFNDIKITYLNKESSDPSFGEKTTIAELYEGIKDYEFMYNDVKWHESSIEVNLDVNIIDVIDSAAESTGYDGNARGKMLAHDDTGYIIISSGTQTNPTLSLFQRVKKYIKNFDCPYTIKGNVAFLNGVVEVKVYEFKYDESLEFSKTIADFIDKTTLSGDEIINETITKALTNAKGYGVNKVVKLEGLTYFNKYNSAGSYLFTDQSGDIVPVYSVLDKHRSELKEGQCYDIIGLESMYNGRPSIRIEKVLKSEKEATSYDFSNKVVRLSSLDPIYQIGETSTSYPRSELTVYSVDAYVSTYGNNKYTFNTQAFSTGNGYTTGTSETDAANKGSLEVFNEDIHYNQTLLDYVINDCKSMEEVESRKVTLYFTLTRLEVVNHRNRWRVNIFEELVYSLDYYNAKEASMVFDTSKATCDRIDGQYQTWSNSSNALVVKNETTSEATIQRRVDYLKIMDGTKLTITFDKPIIGFTLFKGSYSGVAGVGDLQIEAYKQFGDFFTCKLMEPRNELVIDPLYIYASGNTNYLKVTSITVRYLEA